MKKYLVIFFILISAGCFAQQKNSATLISDLIYKGETLINIGSYTEAVSTLKQAAERINPNASELIRCNYLLGRAYFCQKQYSESLEKYHETCSACLAKKDMEFYAAAILDSGRAFFELKKWKEALPHFEYVVANGKQFLSSDYNEALQKLFVCYNKCALYSKTKTLFEKFSENDFEKEVYLTMCLHYGNACAALNKKNEAYAAYSRLLENRTESPASAEKTDKIPVSGIDEFLLNFAVEAFRAKDFEKAEEYLSKIGTSEQSSNSDIYFFKNLYEAKILLEKNKAVDAEKKLSVLEQAAKKSEAEKAADAYYSTLLQCKIQNEKWDEIPSVFNKIKSPDDASEIIMSTFYYRKGQYDKVKPLAGEMYASALCHLGKYSEACREYEKLGLKNSDYAKALFYCGEYNKAYQIAAAKDDYISGLCCINTKNWKKASEHFSSYIKNNSAKNDFKTMSLFYKGYAEYCLAEYKNAYSSFVRFGIETDNNTYRIKATELAINSALQTGDFKNASSQAENLVRYSGEGEEKQKAVILSAEIFADYENYDAAINLLAPYTSGRNDFASQALFMTAEMYGRKGSIEKADELYRRIYEGLPRTAFAEEAMYRSGEVFYSAGRYAEAYSRLNAYIYKFSSGTFSEAAFFYCGDSALRLREFDRSVMLNRTLLQKYPSGLYAYGANRNLLAAFYEQENYSEALSIARNMMKNYPEQAAEDEVGKRLLELEKIVSGADRRVAEKQTEYNKAGASKTKQGRGLGTQLVRLYAESLYTQTDAYKLATELFPLQTSDSEKNDAAFNAEFIADYSRKNQENKKAAEMYLKAAEYYRSVQNSERAAVCLYGAAEAFAADGLTGDARETAALLKELYPDSIQADKVDRVTGGR